MQTRRSLLVGAAALAASASLAVAAAYDFITITDDGEFVTSPMPPDETVVEVKLTDGTVCRAWYSCSIMEAGDWDFVAVGEDDEPDIDADSIANRVIAWRRL